MRVKKRNASTMVHLSDLLSELDRRAPFSCAENWDQSGLLVGESSARVQGAVISIDLTHEAILTAQRLGYRLILNHHPCIFPKSRGLSRCISSGPSELVFRAARAGISVVSLHTNFDRCALEVPEGVSKALGFKPLGRLFDGDGDSLSKLVVFVPSTHLEKVRNAVCSAGAGKIGRYGECTFGVDGEGTFRGSSETMPFLGRPARLERVREIRLETIFPRGMKKAVLRALREAHPYEEIAYDLYRVEQEPSNLGMVSGLGYGVYGDFPRALSFAEIAKRVKKTFGVRGFLQTEPAPKRVKRIGFVAGKGASFAPSARAAGCELFITGEAGYHVARESAGFGLGVMEIGHRESEVFFLRTLAGWCREWGISTKVLNTPIQAFRS